MTVTDHQPTTAQPEPARAGRRRGLIIGGAALLVASGLGVGLGVGLSSTSHNSPPVASASYQSMQSYYQSVMGRFSGGGMMGGDSMMGANGYGWMMGGTVAPGWMSGSSLPGSMMGSTTDPSKVMGSLFADAPGPRVSSSEAARLADQTPSGADVDRAKNTITFTTKTVDVTMLASPASGKDMTFRVAGLTDPTLDVPAGAQVSLTMINADPDMAHGVVVTADAPPYSYVPMMSFAPAFSGAAVWFLGNPTSAGMHEATLHFTASQAGNYYYLCAVPGHAQKGMYGNFVVR